MYGEAEKYFTEHGDLVVPGTYKTADGKKLEAWLARQRRDYKEGKLPDEKIRQLDLIGMVWDRPEYKWEQNYNALRAYFDSYKTTQLPYRYVDENGFQLFEWLNRQKQQYKKGKLPVRQAQQLREIGIEL